MSSERVRLPSEFSCENATIHVFDLHMIPVTPEMKLDQRLSYANRTSPSAAGLPERLHPDHFESPVKSDDEAEQPPAA